MPGRMRCFSAAHEDSAVIVTILGGSAPSTPTLVDWLARQQPAAKLTIRLAGRNQRRLAAVARAGRLLTAASRIKIEQFESDRWGDALTGADVVIVQVRIGGYEGRAHDEAFPLLASIPGDEGLGPGGLSAAVRTWPVLREILTLVRTNAPDALPILLTSPGSLLVRLAALEFPLWPLYGICELPYTTLRQICTATNCAVEDATFSYTGVNHLGWLHGVRYQGTDLIKIYREQPEIPFAAVVRDWNAVPLKYARLHFEPDAVIREQSGLAGLNQRARQLACIQSHCVRVFETGSASDIRHALTLRAADWYSEAIGPLLLELASSFAEHRPYFCSVADINGEVSEIPHYVHGRDLLPGAVGKPPHSVHEFVRSFMDYEKCAASAISTSDAGMLTEAVCAHPWVKQAQNAGVLVDEILKGATNMRKSRGVPCLN